jgi:hypothetical protein
VYHISIGPFAMQQHSLPSTDLYPATSVTQKGIERARTRL